MRERLAGLGFSQAAVGDAVRRLVDLGYLSDRTFAWERAASLAARGYGNGAIGQDLEARGVGAEHIAAAIAGLEPEAERARRWVRRRYGDRRAPEAWRDLIRRGFEEGTAAAVLGWVSGD